MNSHQTPGTDEGFQTFLKGLKMPDTSSRPPGSSNQELSADYQHEDMRIAEFIQSARDTLELYEEYVKLPHKFDANHRAFLKDVLSNYHKMITAMTSLDLLRVIYRTRGDGHYADLQNVLGKLKELAEKLK